MSQISRSTPATLLLADGTKFSGLAIGFKGITSGELCFNTGMTGYQEIFTDPSYYGQLMVMTNAHIGNYAALDQEKESIRPQINGLIVNEFSRVPSRPLSDQSLEEFMIEYQLIGISNIDTRQLVRKIRTEGAMNGVISSATEDLDVLQATLSQTPEMAGLELASKVSTEEPYYYGNDAATYRIAAIDYGIKTSILRRFVERDCYVRVYPASTSYDEIQKWQPDGYFLSNGPGDPSSMTYAVNEIKKILADNKPIFGICLGHQLLGLAMGISTYKMHHGHRGINHPVKNLITGKGEITSQNHGFGIQAEAIEKHLSKVDVTHVNLNDQTVEGFKIKGKKAFSIQYHPEASPGPHDSRYLFDEFIDLL
ncbi:MAG: glutamine-hydrolyzing carbamoyl-phosphate synthase small subunit [Bacteroidetes bacterium]|jgi:carbamoyl-phosphate synthase small subunit|nr:glutamine-hydrolyzing carbamoyl-phosphate synthase small subunit [Bacteroidota bacterium]